MPVLPTCQFYQHASSTNMPVLPTCPFQKTLKIIPLLSNAKNSVYLNIPTPDSLLPFPSIPCQRKCCPIIRMGIFFP
ncbi:hypothetical protein [Moorena sp. SIO2C4]|uniref:hypothetical protein n=1 Tax=Moorena sp. SIO2C4 TaxID=2607824 RepID=UPI0013C0AB2A|nr:hypothetical protein [Moorena sp. SIO2C4]NEQ17250.1 hypothetical protein [Moorena sp. SIO3E2]NES40744.1 hypothetical protein [Moorena sp. SIO2C4]